MTRHALQTQRRRWLLPVWSLTALVCGCGDSAELSLPPEDDAFVSYYQAAHGLASGLVEFRSTAEFEQQRPKIDPLVDQLRNFREQVQALPAQERQRLAQQHGELVKKTNDACRKLEQFHAEKPEVIGDRWESYWEALQIRDAAVP